MLLMEKPAEAARLCGLTRLTDTLHGRWIREMVFGQGDMTLLAHRGSYKTTCLSFAMAVMLVVLMVVCMRMMMVSMMVLVFLLAVHGHTHVGPRDAAGLGRFGGDVYAGQPQVVHGVQKFFFVVQ